MSERPTQLSAAAPHHLLSGTNAAEYGLLQLGLHIFGLLKGQAVHPFKCLLPLHGEHNMGLVSMRQRMSGQTENKAGKLFAPQHSAGKASLEHKSKCARAQKRKQQADGMAESKR